MCERWEKMIERRGFSDERTKNVGKLVGER
jgi:hypothetical protein